MPWEGQRSGLFEWISYQSMAASMWGVLECSCVSSISYSNSDNEECNLICESIQSDLIE